MFAGMERAVLIMRIFFSVLMVLILMLSTGGCAAETGTGGSKTSDIIDPDQTGSIPAAASGPAAWPTSAWSTSSAQQQGLDPEMLDAADKKIKENYPNVYSLLVVRHGYLVFEKYYQGMDKNDANPVYSVTKSVMSALTGIALRDGLIAGTDQKFSEFYPEYFTQIDDPRKKDITIQNVLTMTGGLESIDSDYYSYFTSSDYLDYVLQKPLTDIPGNTFVYNTGLTNFLSAIISRTSGMNTKDYADKYLFSKIGISVDTWDCDNHGNTIGGTGISMKPTDMAKFGYLYLNNGLWDRNQIIPANWIEESTQKHISANKTEDYGYLFWLLTIQDKTNNKEYDSYRASGMGGQYIMEIPDLDMVIVVTATGDSSSKDGSDTMSIITDYVIPSAE